MNKFDLKRVIIESPYAAKETTPKFLKWLDRWQNRRYARRCIRDSILRDEAPLASHLLYTQKGILCDQIPFERSLGIEAGLTWSEHADAHVAYVDRGMSHGMMLGLKRALHHKKKIEIRSLDGNNFLVEFYQSVLKESIHE